MSEALRGFDSLLSIVQMPPGVPVATVAVGRAGNAALLALQMLALADDPLAERLAAYKRELAAKGEAADRKVQAARAGA
jgi:5-(carboxyamino)imidazole ribonucleotide mutase